MMWHLKLKRLMVGTVNLPNLKNVMMMQIVMAALTGLLLLRWLKIKKR